MSSNSTNWIGILVSVVVSMLIGFLFYGALFQDTWMAGNGITMEGENMFKNGVPVPMSSTPMVVNTVCMIAYALIMNWLLGLTGMKTLMGGLSVGAGIGAMMFLNEMTGNFFAQNPMSLTMVDGGYSLVLFTAIGGIIGALAKR